MENNGKVEKLNSIRNEMTHLWGSVFIVGGGALALILNASSIKDYLIGTAGFILAHVFFNAYFIRRNEVVKIVKSMEEE